METSGWTPPATCMRPGIPRGPTPMAVRTMSAGSLFPTDHGNHWPAPLQAPPDRLNVPHIMEVAGAGGGGADVGWLSDSDPRGYAVYLRAFSITRRWLSEPLQVSAEFGDPSVWPGDTIGIPTLTTNDLVLS